MDEFIIAKIETYVETLLVSMEMELVDIEFRLESAGWVLRVFIDGKDGVTLEQCAKISRELGYYLDVEDIIGHAYNLEVSSPGLDRPLKKIKDYQRFVGRTVRIKFREKINNQKVFYGSIVGVENDIVELLLDDEETLKFTLDRVRNAKLTY